MVCGVIVGSLVWKLGSLTPTDVGVNHWSAPFVKLFKRSSNNSVGRYSRGRLGNECEYTTQSLSLSLYLVYIYIYTVLWVQVQILYVDIIYLDYACILILLCSIPIRIPYAHFIIISILGFNRTRNVCGLWGRSSDCVDA